MPRQLFLLIILSCLTLTVDLPFGGLAQSAPSSSFNTITVNSTADVIANDGQCTLREAVTAANTDTASGTEMGECVAGAGEDLIVIPAGQYLLNRIGANEDNNLTGDLDVRNRVTLRGVGANQTILDGNGTDRVIQSNTDQFTVENLSVINGVETSSNGGGIAHFGPKASRFSLYGVSVRNNRGRDGGGIYLDDASFLLEASEVSENSANNGGAIYGGSIMGTMRMSTISNNHAFENGNAGGVYVISGNIAFDQMTIVQNRVGTGDSGIGGGIHSNNSSTSLKGSLIADNFAGNAPNCFGAFSSLGGNLINDPTGCNFPATSGDQVNIASLIGKLQDNGGPGTRTHALYDNSPALDHGSCDASTTDQRGFPRPVDLPTIPNSDSTCDVGAFEVQNLILGTPTPTGSPTPIISPTITPTPTPRTIITVNSTADVMANDGFCTLREAITAANNNAPSGSAGGECIAGFGEDMVIIPAGHYMLTRVGANEDNNATGDLDIQDSLVLRGAGANQTILDGNGTDRVLQATGARVFIESLAIVNGNVPSGYFPNGGGIAYQGGDLTLRRVSVRNNRAADASPDWNGGDGGGVYLTGTNLSLEESEISENRAGSSGFTQRAGYGGGIYASSVNGTMRMSTISNNDTSENGRGGGAYLVTSFLTFTQMTIVQNRIGNGTSGAGGGVVVLYAWVYLKGTLLADNLAAGSPNCSGDFFSQGGNLISSIFGCAFEADQDDQVNINPFLGGLQDNGGFGTRTHALLDDSPAIDHGSCSEDQADQRGYPRPIDHPSIPGGSSPCDSGAYELTTLAGTPTVTLTSSPAVTGTPTSTPTFAVTASPTLTPTPLPPADIIVNSTADAIADDGSCSLREAISAANSDTPSGLTVGECAAGDGADTILVPAGYYLLTLSGADEDNNLSGDLDIRSTLHLVGVGSTQTQLNGNRLDRILHVASGNVTVSGMTLTGGKAPDVGEIGRSGGGILMTGGTLIITHVRMQLNVAGSGNDGGVGGAIAQWGGILTISDSFLSQNRGGSGNPLGLAGAGGGIFSRSSLTVIRTTFEQNIAGYGGFDPTPPNSEIIPKSGGAIYSISFLNLRDSTFAYNQAYDGAGLWTSGTAIIQNSTFSGNKATAQGGGIFNKGGLDLVGGTIARNEAQMGGGLYLIGEQTTVANSILYGNIAQECFGWFVSQGYILMGDESCGMTGDPTGNQIGVAAQLLPLNDYGGATFTHALAPDSPARDAGKCFELTTDQRGVTRPSDLPDVPNVADGCDIGAYEEQSPPIATPTTTPTMAPEVTITPTATTTSPDGINLLYLPLIRR